MRKGAAEKEWSPKEYGRVERNNELPQYPLGFPKPCVFIVYPNGDLFDDKNPEEWIDKVFAIMARSPRHKFRVLTNGPGRLDDYAGDAWRCGEHWLALHDHGAAQTWPLSNVDIFKQVYP